MKCTDEYAWVKREGDNVRVGVTGMASRELGEIVYIELPKLECVQAGEEVAVLESQKAAFDTYAPLSGEIIEVNQKLQEKPGLINTDPHGQGWLYVMKVKNLKEYEALADYDEDIHFS